MDFKDYLVGSAKAIDKEVSISLTNFRKEVGRLNKKLLPLVDIFIEANSGGKRLRGSLVRLGYELTGRQYTPEILKPAAAVEVFQTAILIHDDIIDQSSTRRSRPTIYVALGGDHYAISQAMVLADIGFFLAVGLITSSDFPDNFKNRAISLFSKMVINTGLGEMLDVELPHLKDRREEDVVELHKLKTSYYTFTYPLMIGWIIAGGGEEMFNQFSSFGENLGLAFQIQDDILGVYGNEEEVGKSTASDIEEGKNTLLITYALEHADKGQKEILDGNYGRGKIGLKEQEMIKEIFITTGALDYSRSKVLKYVLLAKKIIPAITKDLKMQVLLTLMADFLITRQR